MPANVETMFYVREAPWHGLGVRVEEAPSSQDALRLSGLDWQVVQQAITTTEGVPLPGYKANLRDTDHQVLGVVTDRYRVVQNAEAFAFTDGLLGEGFGTRLLGPCKMAGRSGFWPSSRTSISSRETRSIPTWCSAIPTTAAVPSRWP